jgi:hypothetical protein
VRDAIAMLREDAGQEIEQAPAILDDVGRERVGMRAREQRERANEPAALVVERDDELDHRGHGGRKIEPAPLVTFEPRRHPRLEPYVVALVEQREQRLLAGETRVKRPDRPASVPHDLCTEIASNGRSLSNSSAAAANRS